MELQITQLVSFGKFIFPIFRNSVSSGIFFSKTPKSRNDENFPFSDRSKILNFRGETGGLPGLFLKLDFFISRKMFGFSSLDTISVKEFISSIERFSNVSSRSWFEDFGCSSVGCSSVGCSWIGDSFIEPWYFWRLRLRLFRISSSVEDDSVADESGIAAGI